MCSQLNPETTVVENLQQAEIYLAQGKLALAQAACQKALVELPDFAPAYKTLGNISLAMSQVEEAMGWYTKALATQPDWAEVYANMGSLYAMQKQWQLAIASYQKAISLEPNIAGFYRNLAKVWQVVGKPELAAECSYQVLTLEPESVTALEYLSLGKSLFDQKSLTKAMVCYGRAIELNPNLFRAYHLLGDALASQGSLDEAINYYQKAVKLQPNTWIVYQKLGKTLLEKGNFSEAIIAFEQAIEINPNSLWSYQKLGVAWMKLKNWDAVINAYLKAIELNSQNGFFYNNLGLALSEKKQWSEAVNAYKSAIELQPNNSGFYDDLAKVLSKQGKKEEAIACYSKVIELNPTNGDAYYSLGKILREIERFSEALEIYQKGLESLTTESPFFAKLESLVLQHKQSLIEDYRRCGKNHKKTGNLTEAIQSYQKVTELQPQSSDYYELGMLWIEKQDWEAIFFCYEKILYLEKNAVRYSQISRYKLLGVYLVKQGKIQQVIDCYHRVFQKNLQNLEFYYQFSIHLSQAGLILEAVTFFQNLPRPKFSQNLQLPKHQTSTNSIYDSIWDGLNQTNSQDFNLHINLESLELESEQIQHYFSQKNLKTFAIDKLHPKELDLIENSSICLEYVKLIRIENHHLENIYINCFESSNGVVKTRTNHVRKHNLKKKKGGYKYLAVEFTQSLVEFGYMYAVCPLTGRVVRSNTSFYLGKLILVYRFEGAEVFYIIVTDFIGSKAALYIPKLNICIAFGKTTNNIHNTIYKFQSYVVANWQDIKNYLRNVDRSSVELYGTIGNLGHFFWQDITGIYYLYEQSLLDKIDYFCGGDSQYLNLLSIFPEIPENKILDMSGMSDEDKFKFMLKNNFFCLRITDALIKQSIGIKINQAAYNLCSQEFIEEVKKAKENNNLLIWVNVRTHNKVWMDQDKNYAKIIDKLSNDFSHLSIGIVFDGTPDASNCVKSIIEQTKSKVSFYNTTLKIKVYESIVLANYIDAYIAVVGSGLVITSWLNDKPGVAHADRAHLGQKCFWSEVKESGIEPTFLNHQEVKQLQQGAYKNYQIDWQIIYKKILRIIKNIEQKKQMTENKISK